MDRYGEVVARSYGVLSCEPVYAVGRRRAVAALGLEPGERVLDLGCGTGLSLPALAGAVGACGTLVGLDRSAPMIAAARRRARRGGLGQVRLVVGDAADPRALAEAAAGGRFDAVIATCSLSLMPDAGAVWSAVTEVLRPGARVAVVDMARPTGRWRWATPLAVLATRLGGADIDAHPWRTVVADLRDVSAWSLRGGHVQVRVGRWR